MLPPISGLNYVHGSCSGRPAHVGGYAAGRISRIELRRHIRRTISLTPLLLAAAATACSVDHPVTSATIPTALVAQVAGTWTGPVTLQEVSAPVGGALDCVGAGLTTVLQSSDTDTLVINQTETNLTAQVTSQGSGLACSYTGTASPGSMVLNAKACDAPKIVVRCANGEVHQVQLIGTTITALVSNGSATGTVSSTYNVFDSQGNNGTSGLTATSSLTAVRQ